MPKIKSASANIDANRKAYPLRIEASLFDAVRERAKSEGRSMNRQFEHLVKLALDLPSSDLPRSKK